MLNTILAIFRAVFLILGGYEQVALENIALLTAPWASHNSASSMWMLKLIRCLQRIAMIVGSRQLMMYRRDSVNSPSAISNDSGVSDFP